MSWMIMDYGASLIEFVSEPTKISRREAKNILLGVSSVSYGNSGSKIMYLRKPKNNSVIHLNDEERGRLTVILIYSGSGFLTMNHTWGTSEC